MTTALVDPDLTFADERMIMFSGYAYAIHSVHAGIDVWHVQAGYWDQNIRSPGYLLPRDGGKNYRRAWDIVASNMPHVVRVYVASWNEYDEGSGIYAADPKGLFVDPAIHSNTDVFSDTDNPYEYVLTTAVGAARINGRPEDDAKFIWHEVSGAAVGGRQIVIRLVVRNEGNQRWTTQERYAVFVLDGEKIVREFPIDDRYGASVAPQYGIVRGEPVALEISLDIPEGEGRHELTLSVGRAGIPFGERLILPIEFDASVGLPVVSATGNADASSVDQLRADVASVSWFHQIDLGNGIVTPGIDETLFKLPKMHIPDRLDGKSVIDIGAWNGAFSFECERRGARRVVAADWNCWQLGNKRGFDIAKRALNSRVEEKEIRVEDLSEEMVGTFDLVLIPRCALSCA